MSSSENIGVYSTPSHELYVDKAEPTLDDVLEKKSLQAGEVTIAIKSSGICG